MIPFAPAIRVRRRAPFRVDLAVGGCAVEPPLQGELLGAPGGHEVKPAAGRAQKEAKLVVDLHDFS